MSIYGNMVGGIAPIKTVTIVDKDGNEMLGVVTEVEVLFTATDNDVREGKTYASNDGISVGTLKIPSVNTPSVLSCTFTKTAEYEPGIDKYTLHVNGLNTPTRHFIIVSCKKAQDTTSEDIIMLRRNDLNLDFMSSAILSTYDTSVMYNIGDNQLEVMLNSSDIQEFTITAY